MPKLLCNSLIVFCLSIVLQQKSERELAENLQEVFLSQQLKSIRKSEDSVVNKEVSNSEQIYNDFQSEKFAEILSKNDVLNINDTLEKTIKRDKK